MAGDYFLVHPVNTKISSLSTMSMATKQKQQNHKKCDITQYHIDIKAIRNIIFV